MIEFPNDCICYSYRPASQDFYIPSDNLEATTFCVANGLPLVSNDWSQIARAAEGVVEVIFDDE
jgi:hypothetical protein